MQSVETGSITLSAVHVSIMCHVTEKTENRAAVDALALREKER